MKNRFFDKKRKYIIFFIIFLFFFVSFAFAKDYNRVISVSPNITDIVLYLNLKDKLVGVVKYSYVKGIPLVGDLNLDIEKIISLKPDIILYNEDLKTYQIDRLKQLNLNLVGLSFSSLDKLYSSIALLGSLFSKQDRAKQLIDEFKLKINLLKEKKVFKDKKVVFIVWSNPLYCFGKDTYLYDIIRYCGGKSFLTFSSVKQISYEDLVLFNPDIVVLLDNSQKLSDFYNNKKLSNISAIKNRAVYKFKPIYFIRGGPYLLKGLDLLLKEFK